MSAPKQEGKLTPKALGDILKRLEGNKGAAYLLVSDGLAEKCVYFSVGAIRLTSMGQRRGLRLEDALSAHPRAGPEIMQRARARQADTGEALEEIVASAFNLNDVVRECSTAIVRDEVLDLLIWDGAVYEYAEANPPPKIFDPRLEALKLSFGVPKLLKECVDGIPRAQKLLGKVAQRGKLIRGASWAYGVPSEGEKDASEAIAAAIPPGGATFDEAVVAARRAGVDALRICEALEKMVDARTLDLSLKVKGQGSGLTKEEEVAVAKRDVQEIEGALDLIINELVARQRLAKGYMTLGDQPKAVFNLKKVGDELLQRNKADEAIEAFREIVKIVPHDFGVREKIAFLFEKMKRVPEAVAEGLDLAKLYKQFGLFNRAKNIFRRIISLEPENVDHRKELIELLVKLRETPDAVAEYENLAELFARRNQENELAAVYGNILALDPANQTARKSRTAMIRRKPGFWVPYAGIAAGFLVLAAVSMYVAAEYRALKAYQETRRVAFERADANPADYAGAQREVETFLARYDSGRTTAKALALKEQLGKLEKERTERTAGQEFARGRQLEAKGFMPQAHDAYEKILKELPGTRWDTDAAAAKHKIEGLVEEADKAYNDIRHLESDRNWREAFERGRALVRKYPWSDAAQRLLVKLDVVTVPPRAAAAVDGHPSGQTPCMVEARVVTEQRTVTPFVLTLTKDGFATETREIDVRADVSFPYTVELKRDLRWQATTLGPVEAAPLIEEDAVYVAGRDQRVWALDPRDLDDHKRARVRWACPLGLFADVTSPPVRSGTRIVVGDRTGTVTGIDAASGKVAWRARVHGPATPLGAPKPGLVILSDEDSVICLEDTGKEQATERWRFHVPGGIAAQAVLDADGSVVVATGDATLVVVDPATGAPRGQPIQTTTRVTAPAGTCPQGFVVATEDGFVRLIARDGRQVWRAKSPGSVAAAPLITATGGGAGASAVPTAYVGAGNALLALRMTDGQELWRQEYRAAIRATPAFRAVGSRIYVATGDGALHALTAETGTLMWSYRTQGEIVAQPVAQASTSTVYVASTDFGVYAIKD